jgi:hypothetical protein
MVPGKTLENRGVSAERATLQDALDAARVIQPDPRRGESRHCVDCWTRGRNAAVKLIEEALRDASPHRPLR